MTEDKGSGATPEQEEPRTVVTPAEGAPGADATPAGDAEPVEERTMIAPAAPAPAGDDERTVIAPARSDAAVPGSATSMPTFANFAPRADGQGIQVGDVLNHIFEVKRFIARGGMGEVFEGINVSSEERVAIKVMLPALAADANVIALFRKEAKTLTKLHHEALVKYRVLAQEPQLGILYIVTEYIDGTNLSDVLGQIKPSPEELAGLLRRLASGLAVAHSFGAIHRDISPDNILLEEGRLDKAKVIDFGIAKDLDPSSKTIVGEGFAGKLNYVAPEQLGDFGREIGPWTDVYSLALVILAVIKGKNVQMGGSLVDAVDKRRQGPDMSEVPDKLRPVLEAMLRPNPKDRVRSMDEVVSVLDGAVPRPRPAVSDDSASYAQGGETSRGVSKPALFGAIAAGVAILGAGAWFATSSGGGGAPSGEPTEIARSAIGTALPSVNCTWLDTGDVSATGGNVAIGMRGVAGDLDAARTELTKAVTTAGVANPAISFADVAQIQPAGCSALNAFRQINKAEAGSLTASQYKFERSVQPAGLAYEGQKAAVVNINVKTGDQNFSLLGIEPSGAITQIFADRAAFDEFRKQEEGAPAEQRVVTDLGDDGYSVKISSDHEGWTGYLFLKGKEPFPKEVTAPALGARGPGWQESFATAAANRDWKAAMVWVKLVDETPD
jgi:serine/threonine-protein kinase